MNVSIRGYTYDECVWVSQLLNTHCQSNNSFTANQRHTTQSVCQICEWIRLQEIKRLIVYFWWTVFVLKKDKWLWDVRKMVCNRNNSGLYSLDSNIPEISTDTTKRHSTGKTMNLRSPSIRSPFTEKYQNIIITVWRNEISLYLYNYSRLFLSKVFQSLKIKDSH